MIIQTWPVDEQEGQFLSHMTWISLARFNHGQCMQKNQYFISKTFKKIISFARASLIHGPGWSPMSQILQARVALTGCSTDMGPGLPVGQILPKEWDQLNHLIMSMHNLIKDKLKRQKITLRTVSFETWSSFSITISTESSMASFWNWNRDNWYI